MGEVAAGMEATNAMGGWIPLSTDSREVADSRARELDIMCKQFKLPGALSPADLWADPENTRQHYVKFSASR
jgi:hypothetical protein